MTRRLEPMDRIISTHALTWSATVAGIINGIMAVFQLTHSRGVRLA